MHGGLAQAETRLSCAWQGGRAATFPAIPCIKRRNNGIIREEMQKVT